MVSDKWNLSTTKGKKTFGKRGPTMWVSATEVPFSDFFDFSSFLLPLLKWYYVVLACRMSKKTPPEKRDLGTGKRPKRLWCHVWSMDPSFQIFN